MRRVALAVLIAMSPLVGAQAAAIPSSTARSDSSATRPADWMVLAQDTGNINRPRPKPRPTTRPAYGGAGAGAVQRPRPGYRPPPGVVHPGYRPGGAVHRPGYYPPRPGGYYPPRPGGYYPPRPGGYYPGWRPAYPGWRPGWAPAPWYGNYWSPGYGWVAATGLIAVGVLAASAALAYSVPPPPNPSMCWFYTDQTYQTGYWAACPPMP